MEKQKQVKIQIKQIETDLKAGKINEKLTTEKSGCYNCQYEETCLRVYSMPCMAHNREQFDSVYYSKV